VEALWKGSVRTEKLDTLTIYREIVTFFTSLRGIFSGVFPLARGACVLATDDG